MLRNFAADESSVPLSERNAVSRFLMREYGKAAPSFEWRQLTRFQDRDHAHLTYDLYHRGRRVVGRRLKVHYNRKGYVEYASSDWQAPFSVGGDSDIAARKALVREGLRRDFVGKYGVEPGRLELEPVIWMGEKGDRAVPGFEVTLSKHQIGILRRFIVDENGKRLFESRIFRSANVYRTDPDTEALQNLALPSLTAPGTTLESTYFHVRRDVLPANTTLVDVDPTHDFSGDAGHVDSPAPGTAVGTYDYDCAGLLDTDCPIQGLEAVNVYYHLQTFRERLDTYFTTLGATVTFPSDPLEVIINSVSVDLYQDGDPSDDGNNAAYVFVPCRDDMPSIERCLVFLRPETIAGASVCGAGPTTLLSIAREALVSVHEYQHYVTDTMAGLVPGTSGYNVGDALHEGYSDYMAASHVSFMVGSDVTVVGGYAFQNCAAIQRDVGTLLPYDPDSTETGPHYYGLSWASGLWQMRQNLGVAAADLIVLKSLLLIPTSPGFVDAVESLVQADKALNDGANVAYIRQLFYQGVQFVGGNTGHFRDVDAGLVEVGLRSCAAAPRPSDSNASALASWILFFLWLASSVIAARAWRRSVP